MRRFEHVEELYRVNEFRAPLPKRATAGSAAYDIYSPVDAVVLPDDEPLTIWTDVKVRMEPDEALIINVRSSMGRWPVMLAHTQGWIDGDYYGNATNDGNISVSFVNLGTETYRIKRGDRIAQAMFVRFAVTDDDEAGGERTGGLGSTGR